jgi:glucose/arabinose dehydrogenase
MARVKLLVLLMLASPALGDDEHPPPAPLGAKFRLLEVARARQPLALVPHGKRLFVAEKGGRLRVIENGILSSDAILDLSDRVSRGSEQGLLGVAWKGEKLYVAYTDRKGDPRYVEYPLSDNIAADSGRELLHLEHPWANHNGGNLVFGPDGKLYIGTGDGGSGYDPKKNGQNPSVKLAKMLRLEVADGRLEILDIGLRNPWRYAFDRKTGDLYIADVGQDRWEEIDVQPAGSGPLNFGWSLMEGRHCLRGSECDSAGITPPILEYSHKTGCSITGGIVYRGKALPELDGAYFYSDYCTAILRSLRWKSGQVTDHWDWKNALDPENKLSQISSFGEDADGELYLLSLDGPIYKLVRK